MRQEELTSLNKTLSDSNQEIEKAYDELSKTQTRLVQQEKMVSLGMLVAGVVHEINNPIGALSCNLQLSKAIYTHMKTNQTVINDENLKDMIIKLEKSSELSGVACNRVSEILKKLKDFARLDEAEIKQIDLNFSIDNTVSILSGSIEGRIEIIKEYGQLPEIECYPDQISEVIFNLLINAIDSIKQSGCIWIKTGVDDGNVFFKIKDSGVGVKQEYIKKIFDPGFTTKGNGVGVGLGLPIVYNIIENHKGSINVSSEYGKGTEFTVELPIKLGCTSSSIL